jgi:putative ABC transport system permease protein
VVQLARDLRDWLDESGKNVGFSLTAAEFKSQNIGGLMIIVYLFAVVAVLIAVVGSIGLSGALSINALERRKEIGVMRAIGASGRSIGLIFVGEGLLIGLISWLIALPISYPLGLVFSSLIGSAIEFDFGFAYSVQGALLWLGAVMVLSVLASGLPAWRASKTSVREVLAYA